VKNHKRWAAILSAGVLTGALAGCSTGGQNATNATNATSTQSATPTLTVALTTGGLQYAENSPNINKDKYVQELDKLAGVKLNMQLIPWGNYAQNMTQLFASGQLPDLLQVSGINDPTVAPAVQAGQFYKLNNLIDKYGPNLKKNIPQSSWDDARVSQNGAIYGIPQPNPITNGVVVYVRKDWMDKLHLQTPKTVQDYIKVLAALKNDDPNGNGKHDEIAFSGRTSFNFMDMIFGAYNVLPTDWTYVNGQLEPNFIQPQMKQALTVYRQMYQQGLIDPESFIQNGKQWDQKIKGEGIVGMFEQSAAYPNLVFQQMQQNNPNAQLEIIPAPTGPDGKGGMSIGSSVGSWVWAIPKSNPHPEEVIKFLNWMYSPQAEQFFMYGLKGQDFTMNGSQIDYKYPTTSDAQQTQIFHQTWLRFAGPLQQFTDQKYLLGEPDGKLSVQALSISKNEGRTNAGLDMPDLQKVQQNPQLNWDGTWLTFAENVITGKDTIDHFDQFVAQWKKQGGDEVIKEATDWYNKSHGSN